MEEHSKRQRRNFAKLSDKIDRAMGQFRSGEARMREEMTSLADTIRTSRVQECKEPPPHLAKIVCVKEDSEDEREPIDKELKRQLNNAIAKSDWPTFSGDDKYDLVGFCRWIDMARSGSYVDDKVIMLKLMTQFTGSALTWFTAATLTKKSEKWKFWKNEIVKPAPCRTSQDSP
ncbi:hypothetical protein Pst134EA_007345 [Puccinia striiformis f. sp. tritici]|nr:hypothetical protein Pst134EA_007345 [Puccinia striiformis f. sp. tritici]KAH9470077.1 hypothetical protein Pst134EA_007345 [Puccinia striiformis f. sp. tritici]